MNYLLIVEDDLTLREGLAAALTSPELAVQTAGSLAEARRLLAGFSFDLLLLDCGLPDGEGVTLCREVTAVRDVPVIFLTVRDSELDEVTAFRAGARDYIHKPFSLTILRERVAAALRRGRNVYSYEDARFRFDFAAFTFSADGVSLSLSATEQKLLSILTSHKGQVLERRMLVDRLWGTEDYIDENALSVTVKRLRDKLGADCIGTVYGLGYLWKGAGV